MTREEGRKRKRGGREGRKEGAKATEAEKVASGTTTAPGKVDGEGDGLGALPPLRGWKKRDVSEVQGSRGRLAVFRSRGDGWHAVAGRDTRIAPGLLSTHPAQEHQWAVSDEQSTTGGGRGRLEELATPLDEERSFEDASASCRPPPPRSSHGARALPYDTRKQFRAEERAEEVPGEELG